MGRYHGQTELLIRIAFGMILFSCLVTSGRAAQRLTASLSARGIDIGVFAYPLAFLTSLIFLVASIALVFAALGGLCLAAEWLARRWRKMQGGGP